MTQQMTQPRSSHSFVITDLQMRIRTSNQLDFVIVALQLAGYILPPAEKPTNTINNNDNDNIDTEK